jgi:signal recognition particle receptor subunit beta
MNPENINISEISKYLKTEKIKVSVFGEFSSGKTTFLNALINENILTVAYEPTTAVPTRIRYAKTFNILVYKLSDKTLKLYGDDKEDGTWRRYIGRTSGSNILGLLKKKKKAIQTFLSKWTKEGNNTGKVKEVIIELPLEWLKSGIELIDTPGTNNEYTVHRMFTESVAQETDIAIMLLDARQGGGKKTELEFMNDVNRFVHESVVVANFMDCLDVEEREDIMQYISSESIPKHWGNPILPEIYGISAKLQLTELETENKEELKNNFASLVDNLKTTIDKKRGSILLKRLGNPEKKRYSKAKKLEKSTSDNDLTEAMDGYEELRDILELADLDTKPADDGLKRCEKKFIDKLENIKALELEDKSIDPKILSKQQYLNKLMNINARLNDFGENNAGIQRKIINVTKLIESIKEDKKEIKKLLSDAEKCIEQSQSNKSTGKAKTLYTSAKKIMIKQGLSTITADEGIDRCKKIINKRSYRIKTLIADYKDLDKDLSLNKIYEKEKNIFDQLTALGANNTTQFGIIKENISSLEEKITIRDDSRKKINALKKILTFELGVLSQNVSLKKKLTIIPKLFSFNYEINELLNISESKKKEIKNIKNIEKRLNKENDSILIEIEEIIVKVEDEISIKNKITKYRGLKMNLSYLDKHYGNYSQYKEFLSKNIPKVDKLIKESENILLTMNDSKKHINEKIVNINESIKQFDYEIIPSSLVVIDTIIKDVSIKVNEWKIFKKDVKSQLTDIKQALKDAIDSELNENINKIYSIDDITIVEKKLKKICAYFKKKEKVAISLDRLTKRKKLINKYEKISKKYIDEVSKVLKQDLSYFSEINKKNDQLIMIVSTLSNLDGTELVNLGFLIKNNTRYVDPMNIYEKISIVNDLINISRTKEMNSELNILKKKLRLKKEILKNNYLTNNRDISLDIYNDFIEGKGEFYHNVKPKFTFDIFEHPVFHILISNEINNLLNDKIYETENLLFLFKQKKFIKMLAGKGIFSTKKYSNNIINVISNITNRKLRRLSISFSLTLLLCLGITGGYYSINYYDFNYKLTRAVESDTPDDLIKLSELYVKHKNDNDKYLEIQRSLRKKKYSVSVFNSLKYITKKEDIIPSLVNQIIGMQNLTLAIQIIPEIRKSDTKDKLYIKVLKQFLDFDKIYKAKEIIRKITLSSNKDIGYYSIAKHSIKKDNLIMVPEIIKKINDTPKKDELYASLCEVYWRKEDYNSYTKYLKEITNAYKGKDKMSYDLGLKYVNSNMLISAEQRFKEINNIKLKNKLGVKIVEKYIIIASSEMKRKGILFFKKREHTSESNKLIKRAKRLIAKISSQSEKVRLNKKILSLTDK